MEKTALCTVVTCDHFHLAQTVMASIELSGTCGDRFVLLVDNRYDKRDFCSTRFQTIPVQELSIPDRMKTYFEHSPFEMCALSKAFLMGELLNRGFERVVFIDADTYVYGSLDPIVSKLDRWEGIFTPHITESLDDDHLPSDITILQAGTINTGFVALRSSESATRFLKWWQEKVIYGCYEEADRGIFVEQRWCDLIASMFPNFLIERHPGVNAAYWNLTHRKISKKGGRYYANDEPLLFFHFSGLDLDNMALLSKYDTRFTLGRDSDLWFELMSAYVERLRENGSELYRSHRYGFNYFSDETTYIAPSIRKTYRKHESIRLVFGDDPFDVSRDPKFHTTYNRPVLGYRNPLTLLSLEIYRGSRDLQRFFPDVPGKDTLPFAKWLLKTARQYKLSPVFTDPIRSRLENGLPGRMRGIWVSFFATAALGAKFVVEQGPPTSGTPQRAMGGAGTLSRGSRISRGISQIILPFVKRARNKIPEQSRQRVFHWMLKNWRKAYRERPVKRSKESFPSRVGATLIGWLDGELGLGEGARSTLRAARHAGINMDTLPWCEGCLSRMAKLGAANSREANAMAHVVNIIHLNPDHLHSVIFSHGPAFLEGHYNIGYWVWEMGRFPRAWDHARDFFDEVWTASTFCQDVFSRELAVPVVRIPHCVEPAIPEGSGRTELGLPEKGTIFLTMADMFSTPERKNPVGAIDAFLRAFGSNPKDTYLVVKLSNSFCRPDTMDLIHKYCDSNSSIILMDSYLSRPEVNALIHCCDCLVSLHRAEGFGLPIAEAMFMGKPVIATGWSGNMDFMNITNSFPVKFTIIENPRDAGPYKAGNFWADPDLNHAAELMYHVASNGEHARSIGEHGAREIRENFSCARVGELIRDRLIRISELTP